MSDKWISTQDELPSIGQKVILFSNGVVQEETYELDGTYAEYGESIYFWARDDLEDLIKITSKDKWMPLPEPPTQEDR